MVKGEFFMGAVPPSHFNVEFRETTKQHEICMNFSNSKRSTQKPHKNIVKRSSASFNLLGVEGFRSGQTDHEQTCPES